MSETQIEKETRQSYAIKIVVKEGARAFGRAYLFLITNDLHDQPYGLLEDVFIEESYRGKGIGTQLIRAAVEEAKARGCYKIVATSRDSRPKVQKLYERLGLKKYGAAFRMEL
ncbi:GNAT family N-acetyltransferase [Candidatus Uhrbacteria bacterium]|nr:GNAT family N-acetyltransferase [Candidatus Uhrbacteria bacterium]